MKRLNRKGFTLVELLAVIVILAIVVGITLVTVLPTLKQSRQRAFDLTADTAADYYSKQYQLYMIGEDATVTVGSNTEVGFQEAGLKADNYIDADSWYYIGDDGRVCVQLKANTRSGSNQGGEYYDVNPSVACSAGCTTKTATSCTP